VSAGERDPVAGVRQHGAPSGARSFVMSASTTVVSWALTCSDSTIRLAITVRSRDSFSVPPLTGVSFAVTWVWETVAGA